MTRIATAGIVTSLIVPQWAIAAAPGTDPMQYSGSAWSPYFAGALIGLLAVATLYFSDKPLGASTAYARMAGMLGNVFNRRHTESLKYFQENKSKVDWEVMVVFGAVLGAFLAAWHGRELTGEWLPAMWVALFGADSLWLRIGVAFAGGIFMAFGARLAGACTSGHGISGTMQLAVGSWISVICFFIGGIAVAMLMFRL